MDSREKAKYTLVFYFRQLFEAVNMEMTAESQAEIENMIDLVIDDAVDVAVDESLTTVIEALKGRKADEQ